MGLAQSKTLALRGFSFAAGEAEGGQNAQRAHRGAPTGRPKQLRTLPALRLGLRLRLRLRLDGGGRRWATERLGRVGDPGWRRLDRRRSSGLWADLFQCLVANGVELLAAFGLDLAI